MSELTLALIVISAVILVTVLGYNKFEQIRLRRRTDKAFGSKHEDVLLGPQANVPVQGQPVAGRVEHVLKLYAEVDTEAEAAQAGSTAAMTSPQATSGTSLPYAALNPAVDYIVTLELARARSGSDVADQAENLLDPSLLSKPVHWEAYDPNQQSWQPAYPQHSYTHLRAGLQLADRKGPADEAEIIAFTVSMQEIALALSGQIKSADVGSALQAGLVLDAFCAEHDIQIGLSVLGREGQTLPGTKIRALAEAAGCVLVRDGRFHKLSDQGVLLYALGNTEPMPFHPETLKTLTTHAISLTLDVPRAPGTPATFRAYIDFARQLSQALGGVLADDERKPINDSAIDQIAAQLAAIYQVMTARGIPAGSPLALRLFA